MRMIGFGGMLCGAALALASPVQAATTWTFTGANDGCQTYPSTGAMPAGCANSRTYTVDGITATATGWGMTGNSNTAFEQGYLSVWSGGLGITNQDRTNFADGSEGGSTSGEHSVDNNDRFDVVLLQFNTAVKLTGVNFGWVGSGSDADFTIRRFGSAGPAPTLSGKTSAGLTSDGWAAATSYNSYGAGGKTFDGGGFATTWIVAAYIPSWNTVTGADSGDDYLKLASVTAVRQQVPEPGSLALIILALAGAWTARRKRNA